MTSYFRFWPILSTAASAKTGLSRAMTVPTSSLLDRLGEQPFADLVREGDVAGEAGFERQR